MKRHNLKCSNILQYNSLYVIIKIIMSENFYDSGETIPIEPNRRLLKSSAGPLKEFYAPRIAARVISLPVPSDQARTHEELIEFRLPVFSGMYRHEELWLNIPEDTRALGRVLRFVARDVQNYGEIFFKLGSVLKQLSDTGIGFPQAAEDRSVLDSFAFAIDENEQYGGNVYLIPPYALNPHKELTQAVGSIDVELEKSELFTDEERQHLMEMTSEGLVNGS